MSEGYTESIQKALDAALVSFGAANNIAVSLENIPYTPNVSTPYLSGYFLPADVSDADLYFTDSRSGIYQIDVNYGSGAGTAAINRMVDLLNSAFKPSKELLRSGVYVEILKFNPERVTIANGWAIKPISINWIAHTARL